MILCNYLYAITNKKQLVEDCVQDVFFTLWNKRETIEITNIKAYLFTATRNKLLDIIKKEKHKKTYFEEQKYLQSLTDSEDEEKQRLLELKQQIYCSIRQLPSKTREIFEKNKLKGLTYVEIAESMEISIKTVEYHMSKALKIIRTNVKNIENRN